MTITEFLLARIAEDETAARAALEDTQRWKVRENRSLHIDTGSCSHGWEFAGGSGVWMCDDPYDDCDETVARALNEAEYITRFDPVRILAECAAKRRIIEFHESWPVLVEQQPTFEQALDNSVDGLALRMSQQIAWLTEQEYRHRFGTEPPTAPMLAALAAVYADHPDYRQEWKPRTKDA